MNFTVFGYTINFSQKTEGNIFEYFTSGGAVNELGHECACRISEIGKEAAEKMELEHVRLMRREHAPLMPYFAEANYVNNLNLEVYYNYFFLIEPEDFPEELRLQGEDDPRLYKKEYLIQVADKIKESLGVKTLSVGPTEESVLRIILRLLSNSEKCQEAKKFLLAHEISHLFYKHQINLATEFQKGELERRLASVAIGILSGIIIKTFSWSVIGIGSGFLVFGITLFVLNILHKYSISRSHEKEADLKAVEVFGPKGGIYFYETIRKNILSYSKNPDLSWFQRMMIQIGFNRKGDFRFNQFVTHPNPRERVEYLSRFTN